MNKNNLTKALFAALLLVSGVVSADEQYPAADFQPTVVYQDPSVKSGSAATTKHEAPASKAAAVEVDSQYPAANFQPQVVYSDANYKHDKSVPAKKSSANTVTGSTSEVAADNTTATAEKKAEDSTATYLLGLVALAAAGFFLFRQQAPAVSEPTKTSSTTAPSRPAGLTGVARYVNRVSGTGVSRYVEQQAKTAKAATGVAKYVAKQTLAAKTKPEAKTGVEKYLRDRG